MSNYNCLTMMILRKCRANYEELTSLINTHFSSCFTDGNAVFTDGEIIFIFYFDAPFHIQVNKWLDVVLTAVNVIGHRIMGRIQEPLADMKIRKESFHSKPGFQKAKGVMF